MIVGSFPVEDPHAQQQQKRSVVYFRPINLSEPFSPSDHMGPQPIVKVQVREDVIPPTMVCSRRILPCLENSMEGILGDLKTSRQRFHQKETKREVTSSVVG